ncbi:MAG: CheR family methyltransferase [Candidatus Omnitrophota bacterium]
MQRIKNQLSPQLLNLFDDFISRDIGISFKEDRWEDLERGIKEASREFGFDDPKTFIQWLMSSPLSKKQIEILSSYLTIGETYFFREKESFDILEKHIIPLLIKTNEMEKKSLRIWCAACSTGEEAYSIAITLDEMKDRLKQWEISILATDINLKALKKAETGIYKEWSFRNTLLRTKQKYFIKKDKSYEILPHIKRMVHFDYLNLAEDVYPSLLNHTILLDIIFCRNVLMYFLPQKAKDVVRKLYRALKPGGWLIVSPTDSFHVIKATDCFQKDPEGSSVYLKCDKEKPSPIAPGSAFPPTPAPVIAEKKQKPLEKPNDKGGETSHASADETFEKAKEFYLHGNYEKALDGLKAIPQSKANGDMYALAARSYANLGHLNEAAHWCQKAIGADRLNAEFYYLGAIISQEKGNEEAAIRALKRCLYVDPHFLLAHFTWGNILLHRKNIRESRKHLNVALSLLESMGNDDMVSREDGLTAGRLHEIIEKILEH